MLNIRIIKSGKLESYYNYHYTYTTHCIIQTKIKPILTTQMRKKGKLKNDYNRKL